jgi:hypothetical protein
MTPQETTTAEKIAELEKRTFKLKINLAFELIKDTLFIALLLFTCYRIWTGVAVEGSFEEIVRYGVVGGSLLVWGVWMVELGAWITSFRK